MNKIDLSTVCWRNDRITRRFVSENAAELEYPTKIPPVRLGEVSTYCSSNDNPYSKALVLKAGLSEQFQRAADAREQAAIIRKAAEHFGFLLF